LYTIANNKKEIGIGIGKNGGEIGIGNRNARNKMKDHKWDGLSDM